ncbi:C4-dicarboxylate transport sensor protein DctB [Actibacterium lipolyticum]|uniref:C4-dicarboxylate transport sensor protein DctB n=2 Tax=Actibacterium lipolyticum TaxID=1524263 RepID=A0A238L864_9RHOB|nr:C4-dicarboxylate transport sensor protein DctB [Actibacterium lipolyticum]
MMNRRFSFVWATVFLFALIGLVQLYSWANAYFLEKVQVSARSTLNLIAESVDQAVGRYAPIPELVARDQNLRQVLRGEAESGYEPFVNEKLRQIAISIDASEVYVMDTTGLTVAASNYRDDDSFLGRNFAFRPYFKKAVTGLNTSFHALGTTSGERGFFFASPVVDGIDIIGVLAVKITVDHIEKDWRGTDHEILLTDQNRVVFLSSREDFTFRTVAPLLASARKEIVETQQYPMKRVVSMGLSADIISNEPVEIMMSKDLSSERYLASNLPLELSGWHAIAFTPLRPVRTQAAWTVAVAFLALLATCLAAMLILQRRANIIRTFRFEQEQRALLEARVVERTADLDAANASLRDEVAERRHAEEQLRKSQKELIQAGKLAALGKMSAAISHEINQPLTAIKSYAVNASTFLARSRFEDAKFNVDNISKMSDRMTEISRHLRNFARQPGDSVKPVNIIDVIEETIGLVGPEFRAQNARITFEPREGPVWALGGKLRLQQVLVNIMTNALEAMLGQSDIVVECDLALEQDVVKIMVRDHGPGVPKEDLEQVFDAFYTTKEAGSGMGLGMSISQNIVTDFGGSLGVENHPNGGAVFTVTLHRHDERLSEGVNS